MNTDIQQTLPGKGKIHVGDRAPDFTLPTQKTGELFHLQDPIGKSSLVLYFYPKDNCTLRERGSSQGWRKRHIPERALRVPILLSGLFLLRHASSSSCMRPCCRR
jgi:hypothetical protein